MIHTIDLSVYHDPIWIRLTDCGRFEQKLVDPSQESVFEFTISEMGEEPVRVEIVNQKTGCVERFYFE